MLRVAPILTQHHLQDIETVFTTKQQRGHETEQAQRGKLTQRIERDIEKSMRKAGIQAPIEHLDASTTWAQDIFEPAFAMMPGVNGPKIIRINVYGRIHEHKESDGPKHVIFGQLRNQSVGAVSPLDTSAVRSWTLEAGGNFETIPPYAHNGENFTTGRVVVGGGGPKVPLPLKASFFRAQSDHDPIVLNSSWLLVQHVDEMISFVRAKTKLGWRLVAIDPMMGLEALQDLKKQNQGEARLYSHPSLVSPESIPTVNQFLAKKAVQDAIAVSAKSMKENIEKLKNYTGITDDDIVRVPAVIAPVNLLNRIVPPEGPWMDMSEHILNSAFPSQVNGVPLSDSVFMASNPFGPLNAQGEDVIRKLTSKAFSKAGYEVDFIDAWELHHHGGDLHCYTNTYRRVA